MSLLISSGEGGRETPPVARTFNSVRTYVPWPKLCPPEVTQTT
jgi:hypothetical protein